VPRTTVDVPPPERHLNWLNGTLVGVEAVPPFCVVHAVRSYSRADGDPGIIRTEKNKSEARFGIYPRGIKDVISR
jgi:hypothetical protein